MGRKSNNGGVIAVGRNRIMYDFMLEGVRYRPSLKRATTEANLRQAREHFERIQERIRAGTFCFAEEFPDFRFLHKVAHTSQLRTCNQVFDEFLKHCEAQMRRGEMSASTVNGYRTILQTYWRPEIGPLLFLKVPFSTLTRIANSFKSWGKKTYNNSVGVLRRAFAFGYRDHPEVFNPACALKGVRLGPRDQPKPDPFRIFEAEALIAGIHRDWGEAQGNYDEFRFFTGLRPSEEIALLVSDYDPATGTLTVTKACVLGIDKDCTKTRQDRVIQLCPRAISILERQLRFRKRLEDTGLIQHPHLFVQDSGEPIRCLNESGQRWRQTSARLGIRHRKPYAARHTSVSWNLIIGKNPLLNAKQHGHSVATMWRVYSAWMEGALESDICAIRRAMHLSRSIYPLSFAHRTWQRMVNPLQLVAQRIARMHGSARKSVNSGRSHSGQH